MGRKFYREIRLLAPLREDVLRRVERTGTSPFTGGRHEAMGPCAAPAVLRRLQSWASRSTVSFSGGVAGRRVADWKSGGRHRAGGKQAARLLEGSVSRQVSDLFGDVVRGHDRRRPRFGKPVPVRRRSRASEHQDRQCQIEVLQLAHGKTPTTINLRRVK